MQKIVRIILIIITITIILSCTTINYGKGETATPDLSNPEQKIILGSMQHNLGNKFTVYDWLVYVPRNINLNKKNIILITGTNGNVSSPDYSKSIDEHKRLFNDRVNRYFSSNFIYLCPILPRTKTNYPIYFPSKDYTAIGRPKISTDQSVLNIITELRGLLELRGIKTYEKVCIEGFSAGGIFATRMAFLHPDKIYAIAAGAPGSYTPIPLVEYKGKKLDFPLGIADYEKLFKKNFDLTQYKSVKQFLYIGVKDLLPNNSTLTNPGYLFSESDIYKIHSLFGATDPEILTNEAKLLKELGCNIEFKTYNTGHNSSFPEMAIDIRAFLKSVEETIE